MILQYVLVVGLCFLLLDAAVLSWNASRLRRAGVIVFAFWSVSLKAPFAMAAFGGLEWWLRGPDVWYVDLYYWIFLAYHLLALVVYPPLLIAGGLRALWKTYARAHGDPVGAAAPDPAAKKPGSGVKDRSSAIATISRRGLLVSGGAGILAATPAVGGLLWGLHMHLDPALPEVTRLALKLDHLHDDLKGFRICQISDLHVGVQVHTRSLERIATMILEQRPDLLVVTGDIVDTNNYFLKHTANFLARLASRIPYGLWAVTGNHDYFHDGPGLVRYLSRGGLRFLQNRAAYVGRGRGRLRLAGVDSPFGAGVSAGDQKNRTAHETVVRNYVGQMNLNAIPEPTVLLMHDPADFPYLLDQNVDLVLSGHTHGGQFDWHSRSAVHPVAGEFYRGLYSVDGRRLYVNRGTASWLKTRINTPAEITMIELE
ncbi:MAG: metallophosphoesterase [bacterium]|nr:metallophosphoesterase [bacterium]